MPSRYHLLEVPPIRADLSQAERGRDAAVEFDGGGLRIVSPRGGLAVQIPLPRHGSKSPSDAGYLEIEGTVTQGPIAIVLTPEDKTQCIALVDGLRAGHSNPIRVFVPKLGALRWLLIGNSSADGGSARMDVRSVRILPAVSEQLPELADPASGKVNIALMAAVAGAIAEPAAALQKPAPILIDAVPIEDLGKRLAFARHFEKALVSRKPLTQWKMEEDDQPIFRYIYREANPRRHLEFGTWQGVGTVYCLEECDATVWTLNLWEGEQSRYGSSAYEGDSHANIGKFYLSADLGHRVCQIFSDSRDWDIANYPREFFDTVLIDGGHQAEVVVNDTKKAIQLLKSGGLCLWHDFAPDTATLAASPATVGVAIGLEAAWQAISAAMSDVFYIWPSQILLAVKR